MDNSIKTVGYDMSYVVLSIKEMDAKVERVFGEALAFYTELVYNVENGVIHNGETAKYILDSLIDYGDDVRFFELYRRLGHYIYHHFPETLGAISWGFRFFAGSGEETGKKENSNLI